MVHSRGGISGGFTIADALREFEGRGYIGQFLIREGGQVECRNCGTAHRPREVALEAMRRVEGVSDPADMVFIGALRCPACGYTGTATIKYGPNASADDATVLRELDNHRAASAATLRSSREDHSLVRDSGWLTGPDG
ncbi:MAG TPA: hypothetical protein VFH78_10250 [Candidatus Thermoplasmatota archaeon]|nr:hypothetical protein [Candidatus Thermoplasmatota archaeon]